MSYIKYREDDIKIIEDRRVMRYGSDVPQPRVPVHYYDCKYCHKIFTDRAALFQHIRSAHNIVRPLVEINGQIASDYCVVHEVNSARVVLYGYNEGICINGQKLEIGESDELDITLLLNRELSRSPLCEISFQSVTVEIELASFSYESSLFINATLERWENEISEGRRLTTISHDNLREGDRLFLDGMYNYYIACRAVKDKAKRYDDAFAMLSRFNNLSGVGKCVLKIIAYRRNWISRLNMLSSGETDDFSVAVDYYRRKPSDISDCSLGKQIYIEDSTRMSLDLVTLFQKRNYELVHRKLSEIPDIEDLDDLNLVDQLNLLSARLAVVDHNDRQAEFYYEKVVTPAFQEEYRLFRKHLIDFGD